MHVTRRKCTMGTKPLVCCLDLMRTLITSTLRMMACARRSFCLGRCFMMELQNTRKCSQTPVFESSSGRIGTRRQLILQVQKPHPRLSKARRKGKPSLPRLWPPRRGNQGPPPLCKRAGGQLGLARQWVMTVSTNQAETKPRSARSTPFGFIQRRVVPLPRGPLLFVNVAGTSRSQNLQARKAWKSPTLCQRNKQEAPELDLF